MHHITQKLFCVLYAFALIIYHLKHFLRPGSFTKEQRLHNVPGCKLIGSVTAHELSILLTIKQTVTGIK